MPIAQLEQRSLEIEPGKRPAPRLSILLPKDERRTAANSLYLLEGATVRAWRTEESEKR